MYAEHSKKVREIKKKSLENITSYNMIEYGWLIYEVSENDYMLGADGLDIQIKERRGADDEVIEYNQLDLPNGRNACTIHASVGAVSDLMNFAYSKERRQELWDSALALDASESAWWHFWKAVDHIRKEWNAKNPDNRLISGRMSYDSPEFWTALDRKHSLVGGYKGNADYNKDSEDGNLEWTSFPKWTYGHCIRIRKKGDLIEVVDNYLGKKKYNRYTISDFAKLIENKVFFNEFYIFLPFATMTPDEQLLIEAQEKGIWNHQNSESPVTRREAVLMIMRASKL